MIFLVENAMKMLNNEKFKKYTILLLLTVLSKYEPVYFIKDLEIFIAFFDKFESQLK